VETVRAPYSFERDDKVVRIPPAAKLVRMNYETSKDPTTLDRLALLVDEILAKHAGENGVVVTTSFAQAEGLGFRLRSGTHRLIVHSRGLRIDDLVARLGRADEPSLLLSPSLFEGVDLAGDVSRFQVMMKAPYYSLGDERMKVISKRPGRVYELMTIMRLVQGLGRSTRSKGDRSVSYFVDSNLVRLFDSEQNAWKSQFCVERFR
jgi:ATP-dependent DNA helicase DinG